MIPVPYLDHHATVVASSVVATVAFIYGLMFFIVSLNPAVTDGIGRNRIHRRGLLTIIFACLTALLGWYLIVPVVLYLVCQAVWNFFRNML